MIDKTCTGRGGWVALAAVLLAMPAAPAIAAEPTGEWLVADGVARVRIESCANRLWGLISWEKEPGGTDKENPDPAKRVRPTLGMPILLGMQPTNPNRWEGEIYNAQNGKTYTANISLASPDQLQVQGCVLGFLCGGQTWTRTAAGLPAQKPAAAKPPASSTRGAATPGATTPGATTGAAASAPGVGATKPFDTVRDVCMAVADATGLPVVAEQPQPAPRGGGTARQGAPAPAAPR